MYLFETLVFVIISEDDWIKKHFDWKFIFLKIKKSLSSIKRSIFYVCFFLIHFILRSIYSLQDVANLRRDINFTKHVMRADHESKLKEKSLELWVLSCVFPLILVWLGRIYGPWLKFMKNSTDLQFFSFKKICCWIQTFKCSFLFYSDPMKLCK